LTIDIGGSIESNVKLWTDWMLFSGTRALCTGPAWYPWCAVSPLCRESSVVHKFSGCMFVSCCRL